MALDALWRTYADTGPAEDAPTYRAIAHSVADDPDLLAVAAAAPPATHHPNHLLAAVRFLLLGGLDHPLADAYANGEIDRAVVQFRSFVFDHRDAILDVLAHRRVQTNEVGRSAVIAPALAWVASARGPLGLLDVGTSAGLNLLVDRTRVQRIPADETGAEPAAESDVLVLPCEVTGSPPPAEPPAYHLSWRLGLDRSPIDLDDEASTRWLVSCVWIDQHDRIERLAAAIELARRFPAPVRQGDAVASLPDTIAEAPADIHLVVLTTWVAFYLDGRERLAFTEALAGAGRPVTWLSLEHPGVVDLPAPPTPREAQIVPSVLGAVSFPGDGRPPNREVLGWAHPHGRWLDWCV